MVQCGLSSFRPTEVMVIVLEHKRPRSENSNVVADLSVPMGYDGDFS